MKNLNATVLTNVNSGNSNSINPNNNNNNNFNPNQKLPKNHRVNLYLQYKMNFIPEIIFGEDSPLCFIEYFNYVKYLPQGQIPDYRFLKNLFKNYLKSIKLDIFKFKYDWVQIMLSENVNLGSLTLSLTKSNIEIPFKFQKEKTESDTNEMGFLDPDDFKIKVDNSKNPRQRKSILKCKPIELNGNINDKGLNGNINDKNNGNGNINDKIISNGNINEKNNSNINITEKLNGYQNGNGIHIINKNINQAHSPENFNDNIINEGKRLSEHYVQSFE